MLLAVECADRAERLDERKPASGQKIAKARIGRLFVNICLKDDFQMNYKLFR